MSVRRPRLGAALYLAAASLAACGSPAKEAVLACQVDAQCGDGAYCVQGACRASSAPVAHFAVPAQPVTARLLTLEGVVTDPDPGDSVSTWAWSIAPGSASCAAEPESTSEPSLQLVFWCAGTYDVSLTATDSHGVTGAPHRERITVAAGTDLPIVTAGPDAAIGHHCAGEPLSCALDAPLSLSATGLDAHGGPVTFKWKAEPPSADRAGAAVVLLPPDAALASAQITTAGTAISGTWRFRVRGQDAAGNLAQAFQVLEVGNRAPALQSGDVTLDHHYAAGIYRATGPVAIAAVDPDGDPLRGDLLFAEASITGCTATLAATGVAAGVLDLACASPASLAAARMFHAQVTDVNGAAADAQAALLIGNHPPTLKALNLNDQNELPLDHAVGPCPSGSGQCFQATATAPFVASDADDDPLDPIEVGTSLLPGRSHSIGEAWSAPVAGVRFSTPVELPAEFRAVDGSGGFRVTGTVSDGFTTSPMAVLPVRIGNRPPVVKVSLPATTAPHRYDAATGAYVASATLMTFEDPDGDPIGPAKPSPDTYCKELAASAGSFQVTCRLPYALATGGLPPLGTLAGPHTVSVQATDGWDKTSDTTVVTVQDAPPAATPFSGTVESCYCRCPHVNGTTGECTTTPAYAPDTAAFQLPVQVDDADGDPLQVSYTPLNGGPAIATRTAMPAGCSGAMSGALPKTYTVTLHDGVSQVSTTSTVTGVTCSRTGLACVF